MNHSSPRLTIVVPVKDRASTICSTLDAIASQTLRPLSLVVVDNASSDGTRTVVERWASMHTGDGLSITVVTEDKPGACAARNRGLREVCTPFVMFFDSDDYMPPCHAARAVKALEGGADVAYWREIVDVDGVRRVTHGAVASGDMAVSQILYCVLATHRWVATTRIVREVGEWNESLHCWNDLEYGLRLAMKAAMVAYDDRAPGDMVVWRGHSESITGRGRSHRLGEWELSLDEMERQLTRAGQDRLLVWIAVRRVALAAEYYREGHHAHARELQHKALVSAGGWYTRLVLRLLYAKSCMFTRGTVLLARVFFRFFK